MHTPRRVIYSGLEVLWDFIEVLGNLFSNGGDEGIFLVHGLVGCISASLCFQILLACFLISILITQFIHDEYMSTHMMNICVHVYERACGNRYFQRASSIRSKSKGQKWTG